MENQRKQIQVKGKSARFFDRRISTRELIFILAVILCLSPFISAPVALFLGLIIAQFVGHPYLHLNHKATHILLQVSVVGLGFGMQVDRALEAGRSGIAFTVVSIVGTLVLGYLLNKFLKIEQKTAFLISAGTAICGGSAIAAVGPVIKAEEKQLSVALGTVFILNAVALFVFPAVGHALNLTQQQFGLWSAIAIHDTSSVVGAASKYGTEALEVATTVKLARALWIIPLAFIAPYFFKTKGSKVKIPWFIGLFVGAMLLNTYVPAIHAFQPYLTGIAQAGLTLTLFLIGCGLNRSLLTQVGIKPFVQGIILWVVISVSALWAVIALL